MRRRSEETIDVLRQAIETAARVVGGPRPAPGTRAVALVAIIPYAQLSSPIVNTMLFFSSRGWQVDVYLRAGTAFEVADGVPGVTVVPMPVRSWLSEELENLVRFRRAPRDYAFVIGFDPTGLVRAGAFAHAWRVPLIYHSLELYDEPSGGGQRERLRRRVERHCHRFALCTLTQDEVRADLLARQLDVDRDTVLVSYNSGIGEVLPEKRDLFRERFGIPKDQRIVLLAGSIIWQHCALELIESVPTWPEGWVLVVHGWFADDDYRRSVEAAIGRLGDRAFLSTELVPAAERHTVFQSADAGLVFFDPADDNLRYAIGSAGKLFDCMRAGVPVIAPDLPGARALIEGNGAGVVVESIAGIPAALRQIADDYATFRDQSLAAFPRYEFTRCYDGLLAELVRRAER